MSARRDFLGQLTALGASAWLPAASMAQGTKPFRIDVHHHLAYPGYLEEAGGRRAGSIFKWSPEMSLEDMDKSGIALSVLSLIQPSAVTTDVEKGRRISRTSNEYAARLSRDHKGRFASFATLPLLDTEGSLKEIAYALDTLKADGVGLMTSYGDKYLGDESFAPVWEELNRRKAVIYTHPLSPECCRNVKADVPPAVVEYSTDTTRTIASLVFSGTASRYPDIRWIFSHSGGTLPFLTGRFIRLAEERKPASLPDGPLPEFRKFYYELAQGNTPGQIAALLKMVSVSQVMTQTLRVWMSSTATLLVFLVGTLAVLVLAREQHFEGIARLSPPLEVDVVGIDADQIVDHRARHLVAQRRLVNALVETDGVGVVVVLLGFGDLVVDVLDVDGHVFAGVRERHDGLDAAVRERFAARLPGASAVAARPHCSSGQRVNVIRASGRHHH